MLSISPLSFSLVRGCEMAVSSCQFSVVPYFQLKTSTIVFDSSLFFSGLGGVLSVPCNPQCGGHRGKSQIFGFIFLHCIHGKASGPWCGHHLIIKAGLGHFQFWCARYHFCLTKDSDDLIYCIGAFCNIQIHCFIKWASTFCARSSTSQFDLWTCSLLYGTLEDREFGSVCLGYIETFFSNSWLMKVRMVMSNKMAQQHILQTSEWDSYRRCLMTDPSLQNCGLQDDLILVYVIFILGQP